MARWWKTSTYINLGEIPTCQLFLLARWSLLRNTAKERRFPVVQSCPSLGCRPYRRRLLQALREPEKSTVRTILCMRVYSTSGITQQTLAATRGSWLSAWLSAGSKRANMPSLFTTSGQISSTRPIVHAAVSRMVTWIRPMSLSFPNLNYFKKPVVR